MADFKNNFSYFSKQKLSEDIDYIYICPIYQIKAHEMLYYKQQSSCNYSEIGNVGATLNLYICGNLCGNVCENWKLMGK